MLVKAIDELRPGASWIYKDGELIWYDKTITKPTKEEIEAKIKELGKKYEQKKYILLRLEACSELNQDELRFDDLEAGTTTWQDSINAIKLKYPRPAGV